MNRRGFLAGILAAAAAPAIVKSGSLMPIYVPRQTIIKPDEFGLGPGDWTVEGWIPDMRVTKGQARYSAQPADPGWQNVALVFSATAGAAAYLNGNQVSLDHPSVGIFRPMARDLATGKHHGYPSLIDELRISSVDRVKGGAA